MRVKVSWGRSLLLRRLTKHVHDQNWFAVGIDFAIVVIGVFIGIQVANWNESRTDRTRGESIKARLAAEFISIESEYARHVRDVRGWIQNADRLAQDLLSGSIDPASQELSERILAIRWRPPSGGSNTVAELINQGDMDLLNSPDLVEMLLEFQTLAERHVRSNDGLSAQYNEDFFLPFHVAFLAAIAPEARPGDFETYLGEIATAPALFVSTMTASQRLQIDLTWHEFSLESACAILQQLDEPCRASDALAP